MLRKNNLIWENLYSASEADVILLGVPFDGTVTETPGTRLAPNSIRQDFEKIWGYDPDLGEVGDVKLHDAGNVEVVHGDVTASHQAVRNAVEELHNENPHAKIITLGGEHSITIPIVRALKPENYLCFDAHWDLCGSYQGLTQTNPCVNKRVLEEGVNVEIRGPTSGSKEEYELASKLGKAKDPVYLSVDLDVLSGVPVGTLAAGTMSFKDLWEQIKERQLIACDVVEYNPLLGKSVVPAELVKKLILKLGKQ
jgi:agmatinase